jgi:glutaredoxin 3
MPQVTMYSTATCKYCKHAEALFKEHNISFQKFDVGADPEKRKEMVEKSGQLGVPVIDIGGEIVVGYDEETIKQLLKI